MKTSDVVQLKRDLTAALDAAGRKEFGWFILLEKLDELGWDLSRRNPSPQQIVAAVEAYANIAEAVHSERPTNGAEADGHLFSN